MLDIGLTAALIGLASGSVYALVALGMTLGFRSGGLVNVAQGDLAVLAAYVGAALMSAGLPYGVAVIVVALAAGGLMLILNLVLLRHLYGASPMYLITVTVGISAIIESVITWHWGGLPLVYRAEFGNRVIVFGPIHLFGSDLIALAICLLLAVILTLWLRLTSLGRDIRASASDPVAAELLGIDVGRSRTTSLALSGVLAGLAGMVLGPLTALYPTTGLALTLAAFVGAVVGGFGSLVGAVVGSLLVGLVGSVSAAYVHSIFSTVIVYGLLVVILLLKPSGLFGEEGMGLREV